MLAFCKFFQVLLRRQLIFLISGVRYQVVSDVAYKACIRISQGKFVAELLI